jgi:hypothetical protein
VKYLRPLLIVLLAIVAGLGVAVYRIAGFESNPAFFHNGSWTGSNNLPLGKDDLLTAQVSVFALFALPGQEAIYLFAKRDTEKTRLHSRNDYIIRGNTHQIHAKYWSITAYGKDLFLVANESGRYSFNNSNVQADSTGNFSIVVSHQPHEGNWLPSPDDARFGLVLRIYRGGHDFIEDLSKASLPEIKVIKQ